MKLNLGCGKNYKKGFVNIDGFDSTVADTIMSVDDLDIQSNSVDEIYASQIIEHLGYIHSIYALAEWFRVLKSQGILVMETPDIDTSFKEYLNGGHKTRKDLLSWIFGVESKGMHHLLCFPEILLKELVKKSGFTQIKTSFLLLEKNHPIIRITCKKSKNSRPYQLVSEYRKKLKMKNLVNTDNDIIINEQEKLIDFFHSKLTLFEKNNDYAVIDKLVLEGSITSAVMTQLLLKECINQKHIQKEKLKQHMNLLDFLIALHFSDLLFYLIKESPPKAGTQNQTVQTISSFAKQSIKKILKNEKDCSEIKKSLLKLSYKYDPRENIIFSEKILQDKAAQLSYKAIKEFTLGHYTTAISLLNKAIRFERNNLLYYWNLGRLFMMTDALPEATIFYEEAVVLVKASDLIEKKKLEKMLQMEKERFSADKYGKPKIDVI